MHHHTLLPILALFTALSTATHGRREPTYAHRRHILSRNDHIPTLFNRSPEFELAHPHPLHARTDCEPADPLNTLTDRLNILLNSSGAGYVLPLCPSTLYQIQAPILFAAPDQEIHTVGDPLGDERATFAVVGPVSNGQGHTTAVDGTCSNCSGVRLRHVQIDGKRGGASPTSGGANIEMGGSNSNQLIEHVRSFDPRSWSCLHIAEGALSCNNVTVQNNHIGPCGSDEFQQWADGISVSCQNSLVSQNFIENPTDGGIVLFGAPGTLVEDNTIFITNMTLLGGINMVDYDPWSGNYTNTIVQNNLIFGGFANDGDEEDEVKGVNEEDAIIKIGIAIGPRTWFGDRYGSSVSTSGTVLNNKLTGAFGFAIAMSSATNFTVQGNTLVGNTSFIGSRGPNCSSSDTTPTPAAFVLDSTVTSSNVQSDFQTISDADSLTCIMPPDGGDYWPYGGNPSSNDTSTSTGTPTPSASIISSPAAALGSSGLSGSGKAGVAIGVIFGFGVVVAATYFIRKWAVQRARRQGKVRG